MKAILIIALLLIGCGGYNIKEDGILLAPVKTVMFYWLLGADKEDMARAHANAIDNCARYGYGCNQPQTIVVNPNQR